MIRAAGMVACAIARDGVSRGGVALFVRGAIASSGLRAYASTWGSASGCCDGGVVVGERRTGALRAVGRSGAGVAAGGAVPRGGLAAVVTVGWCDTGEEACARPDNGVARYAVCGSRPA